MEAPIEVFLKFTSHRCANVYMVSWIDVTENRHVGRRSHLRPKDTLAEVTFLSHNAAEYIDHAQLLAMDYSNVLTAVAVRNNKARHDFLTSFPNKRSIRDKNTED